MRHHAAVVAGHHPVRVQIKFSEIQLIFVLFSRNLQKIFIGKGSTELCYDIPPQFSRGHHPRLLSSAPTPEQRQVLRLGSLYSIPDRRLTCYMRLMLSGVLASLVFQYRSGSCESQLSLSRRRQRGRARPCYIRQLWPRNLCRESELWAELQRNQQWKVSWKRNRQKRDEQKPKIRAVLITYRFWS